MVSVYEEALACECFITGDHCLCEEGCECGCPDCACDSDEWADLQTEGCACGGNCSCNISEDEGGELNESDENN